MPGTAALAEPRLLLRSSFCALGSLATWAMVSRFDLTIVQASALQGLLGCLVLPKSYALANFCGSFAGMSAHPGAIDEASLMALACTAGFYWFENKKLALGRGGRLGLIAFLSNLAYFVVRKGPQTTAGIALDVLDIVRPATALQIGAAAAVMAWIRQRQHKTGLENQPVREKLVKVACQSTMLAVLVNRLAHTDVSLLGTMVTFWVTFVSSILTWISPYTIAPVAALGVLSGFLTPNLAPAIYMGSFVGMCSLPRFRVTKFFRAAAFSAILLKLGILSGFGGRLGFLAYLGVNFAI